MAPYDHQAASAAFRDQLRPFTSALHQFVIGAADRPLLPTANSPAMGELAEQSAFATPAWNQPATNSHTYGRVLASFLLDHADAYAAAALGAELGPVWAHGTLLRAVVDTAPTAGWVLEPHVGTKVRIQRGLAYRLQSALQQHRQKEPQIREAANQTKSAVRAYAGTHHWVVSVNPADRPSIAQQKIPHPINSFSELLGLGPNPSWEGFLWNALSAQLHGAFYVLSAALVDHPDTVPDPLVPFSQIKALHSSAHDVLAHGLLMARAVERVIERRDTLMGWRPSRSEVEARADLHRIGQDYVRFVVNKGE